MTSTRRTIPAPPPNGVSSTWPQFSGVVRAESTVSSVCPSASAFDTCRCSRNHSNHCGNSVKTSMFIPAHLPDRDPAAHRPPDDDGRLTVGGCALADIAAEFGTPALVFDAQGLRETAREYLEAFRALHSETDVHFASKALPCAPVTRILAQEGLGCDVASAGELAIALAAGFDPTRILLHGNAKTDRDLGDALAAGVG